MSQKQQQDGDAWDEDLSLLKEFTAREPDSYAEAVRQREILRTSSEVNKLFTDTEDRYESGEIDKSGQRAIVRAGIEQLIREIEHIASTVGATDLLYEREIYTVRLGPPDDILAVVDSPRIKVIGNPDLGRKTAGKIKGLEGYLNAPEYFSAEWTVHIDKDHEDQQPFTWPTEVRMPVDASHATFRAIRQFLAKVKLDLGPNLPDYMGEEGPGI